MQTILFDHITIAEVLGLIGGGVGVSIVAQVMKRLFKLKSSKVIQFLVAALAVVATVLAHLIALIKGNGAVLGSHAAGLLGAANVTYTFIVSDLDAWLQKVKTALANQDAAAPVAPVANSTTLVTPGPAAMPTINSTPPANPVPPAADF